MKKFKFLTFLFVIALIFIPTLSACGPDTQEPEIPNDYAKIKIDKTELVLLIGESDVITAQTTDENATVEWNSSNPAICTVENGVVTGMNKGQAIISATYGGESVYCAVTVNARNNPASEVGYTIELNRDSIRLTSEETFNIVAELYNTKNEKIENATFTYTSSAPSVVSVNSEGKITAVANGTAKIVVKYSDDADKLVTAVLSVTVADEYMIELEPLTSDPEINSQVNLVYSVLKNGEVIEYPANQVSVTSTNSSIVRYENGKLFTGNAGIAEITVTLLTENVSATMEVIVLDPNAPAIVLGCENFELYTNGSMNIPVTGVSWGTLVYTVSNDEFTVNNGVIYAPATEGQCTLTIRHRETRQQIQCTVTAKEFDNCIMTASQFMEIGVLKSGEEVYLGADIDLSAEEWTAKAGLSFVNNDIVLAYLIEELNAKIDGRGHKITVRYDHSCADNAQLAGIFAKVTENGQVSNLVIDFEAKYYGQDDAASGVNQAVKQSVVTYYNLGRVWNNHVTARFYADNYANRESLIGYWGGSVHNNLLDIQVFKNNSAIAKGSFLWEQKGGISQNNVVVNPNITSASHATLFYAQDDFIDGWNTFAGKNEWINGGWSVDGRYLKLSDTTVHTKLIGVVSGLKVSSRSIVNWNEVNGAESYKLRIKWSDESNWTNLMDSNVPSWDVGSYLKNMGATALNAKAGKYISLQVACDMGSSGMGDWYELSNALGVETSQGSGTKNLVLGIAGDANSLKTLIADKTAPRYIVLTSDINLQNVASTTAPTADYSYFGDFECGVINGLGHKITYTYDDTSVLPTAQGVDFSLFNMVGGTFRVQIMNLTLDASITSTRSYDDMHISVLAHQYQAETYNVYFKVRATTTNRSASDKSRIVLTRRLISNSTGAYKGSFENCVFDMVSKGTGGTVRAGGSSMCDMILSRNESNVMGSGAKREITNCVFITNQSSTDRTWTENDSNVTATNSSFLSNFSAFCSAWTGNTLSAKQGLQNAGWSVEGTTVKLNGVTVNG